MAESAIGLIETRGLVGVIEAADTAAKAADVQLVGFERVGGGLVSVRFRGDTAAVQTAVRAAREAACRVSELVSAHVIPAPRVDVEAMLGSGVRDWAPIPQVTPPPATTDLASLPVTRLRQLARKTPGLTLQGRQVSRANKQQLLDELRRALGADAG